MIDTRVETTLSKSYQITLPSAIRKALRLEAGDPLEIEMRGSEVVVKRAETREEKVRRAFEELDRMVEEHRKNMTPEQKAFAEKTKGWTANQLREYIDNLPETRAYYKEKYGI